LNDTQNLSLGDQERLFGFLEGSRRVILPEPQPLLTETPRVPGLDGKRCRSPYGNAIMLREDPASVTDKIRTMQTDPPAYVAAIRAIPRKCPVWGLHKIYSTRKHRTGWSKAARRPASDVSNASSR
jgi:tryptophanyl-tRNA synthetase